MSFNNNSRNVANLLRFQPLQPLRLPNQQRINQIQPPSRQKQIPVYDVFTPDDNQSQKRNSKRIAPLSQGGNNRNQPIIRVSSGNTNNHQVQSLRIRLEQIVKFYDERHSNLQSKIMIRLNQLQNFVMKQVPKIDNTIMISSDMAGFKQIIKDVRKQQQYQFNQINILKASTQQRANTQNMLTQNSKQKQKMTVLFMQLVRLGDTIQKITDQMNYSTRNYQSKIQDLQQKLVNSQKNLSIISQRTTNGSDILNEFGDKLMNRLQSAESNLLILGKEQIKDKQIMNKIVAQNQRIGEDINTMILNMQTDFQNKLQNRMNQTLNRLMSQHEERIRAQQEIRKNLDLWDRTLQQKQQSQRLQNRARLQNMDAAVRNEFIKKQQSIRSLQSSMQQQFRTLVNEIQLQGNKRKQQQTGFRFELKKVQQSFRRQYDLYKTHQHDIVDKITQMVKAEIASRISTELDLKKLTTQVGNTIVSDLNNVKEAISTSNKKLNIALKQVSSESADRAAQLSHYIDQEVKKVVDVVTQKYSKMKNVFTKLAQQFKNHLLNTQTNRKNHQSRLTAVEQDFQKLKSQVNSQIDQFYNDLQARLKQQKQFVQTVVFKKTNQLTLRVNKLQQYTNQYFQVLKTGIQDNKQLLNSKVKNGNSSNNQQSDDEIKQLRGIIFDIKNITEEVKVQNSQSYRKLDREIQTLQEKTKQSIVQLGNNLNTKITKNTDKIIEVQGIVSDHTVKLNSIRAQSGSENAISNDRVKKLSDQINTVTQKLKNIQQKSNQQNQKTDEEFIKIRSQLTVLKGQVGALDDDIKKLSKAN